MTLQQIIQTAPRASFARHYIKEDDHDPRRVMVRTGSPADAVRVIEAVRAAGYFARLEDPRQGRQVVAATVACLI